MPKSTSKNWDRWNAENRDRKRPNVDEDKENRRIYRELNRRRPPPVIKHSVGGIYSYDFVTDDKLRVRRTFETKGGWKTETRIISAGESAWGWIWKGRQ